MRPTGSNSSWDKKMNCPGNQKVSQIKIQVPLHVPDGCNAAAYYADMGHTFLESYSQDQFFQMSVQGVGTSTWWLQGSVRLKENVRLRSARSRVRKILLDCHSRHVLNTELNTKFGDYLASELKVTSDAAQLSGNSHWWTPSSLREQSSTLAVPAAALSGPRTVDVVPGPAAPSARAPGAPTWAFSRHRGARAARRHCRRRDRPKSRYSSSSRRRPRPRSAAPNAAQGPSRGVRIVRAQEGAPRSRRGDSRYGQGPRLRADPCAGGGSPCAGACVDRRGSGAASSAQEFGLRASRRRRCCRLRACAPAQHAEVFAPVTI